MKKIVGILAAAAMAGSLFAVDVSSMIQIDGSAMSYSEATGFQALMAKSYDPSGDSDYLWKLSASGDNYGAEIWSWTTGSDVSSAKIWFSPIADLKFTVGNVGGQSIANPHFGWWAQSAQAYGYGYQVEYNIAGVGLKLALEPGAGNFWFDSEKVGLAKVGTFWAEATYSLGEIGNFQAVAARNANTQAHVGANMPWVFGAAYTNTIAGAYVYGDAYLSLKREVNAKSGNNELAFAAVDSQIGADYSIGALNLKETNVLHYDTEFSYGFEARATYGFGVINPYINVSGYDITNTKELYVDVAFDTNIGSVSINAGLDFPVNLDDYTFSVTAPVEFTLHM